MAGYRHPRGVPIDTQAAYRLRAVHGYMRLGRLHPHRLPRQCPPPWSDLPPLAAPLRHPGDPATARCHLPSHVRPPPPVPPVVPSVCRLCLWPDNHSESALGRVGGKRKLCVIEVDMEASTDDEEAEPPLEPRSVPQPFLPCARLRAPVSAVTLSHSRPSTRRRDSATAALRARVWASIRST